MSNSAHRFIKQLIYGSIYLVILGGLIYASYLYVIYNRPASCLDGRQNQDETGVDCGGTCVPCGLETVKPLLVNTPRILKINDNTVSIIAEVKNLNLDFGATSFDYHFNFYNSTGTSALSVSGTSFIYPGEIKTMAEPVVVLSPERAVHSEMIIDNLTWVAASDFIKPATQIRDLQTRESGNEATVSGLIINTNNYPLSQAGVVVVVADNLGLQLGVTKTLLRDLTAGEQRFFSVNIPLAVDQSPHAAMTRIFVEPLR